MEDILFIVVYRDKGGRWKAISEGEFDSRRLAENFIECKRATGWKKESWDFAIVEGPIVNSEDMAAQEAALGVF